MAAPTVELNARIYGKIGGELISPPTSGVTIPGAAADMTAFRSLTAMSTAAALLIEIDGVDYAIPLLTNA